MRKWVVAITLAVLTGCETAQVQHIVSGNAGSPIPPGTVIVSQSYPSPPITYRVIARVHAEVSGTDQAAIDTVYAKIKQDCAALGANGFVRANWITSNFKTTIYGDAIFYERPHNQAVQRVMKSRSDAGKSPGSLGNYIALLKAIDVQDCPDDFKLAWNQFILDWESRFREDPHARTLNAGSWDIVKAYAEKY